MSLLFEAMRKIPFFFVFLQDACECFSILTVFATFPWFGLVWLELGSDGRGAGLWAASVYGPWIARSKKGPVEPNNQTKTQLPKIYGRALETNPKNNISWQSRSTIPSPW